MYRCANSYHNIYLDAFNKQWLFYPDYIVMKKDGKDSPENERKSKKMPGNQPLDVRIFIFSIFSYTSGIILFSPLKHRCVSSRLFAT